VPRPDFNQPLFLSPKLEKPIGEPLRSSAG
jgi:hypothetical protein